MINVNAMSDVVNGADVGFYSPHKKKKKKHSELKRLYISFTCNICSILYTAGFETTSLHIYFLYTFYYQVQGCFQMDTRGFATIVPRMRIT